MPSVGGTSNTVNGELASTGIGSPAMVSSPAGAPLGACAGQSHGNQTWVEFCEQHAATAAEDFARQFKAFIQENPSLNRPNSATDFASKFMEFFMEHFEVQTTLRHLTSAAGTPRGSPSKSPKKSVPRPTTIIGVRTQTFDGGGGNGSAASNIGGSHLQDTNRDMNVSDGYPVNNFNASGQGSPSKSRSFFRRFSFRGIRSGVKPLRQLFKQHSDEVELSSPSNCESSTSTQHSKKGKQKHDKTKMTKMLVECVKEGIVNQLVDEDYNGKTKWEKCRLVLIKTPGGYMLEFFIPPKVCVMLDIFLVLPY